MSAQRHRGLAVFAYGSLVSAASAALTLGRAVELGPPVRLAGWARGWDVVRRNEEVEKTFARADGTIPRHCLGLGIEPLAGSSVRPPNGALIEITEDELERLERRELRYERVDVTSAVLDERGGAAAAGAGRVVAFRARPEHRRRGRIEDAIVVAAYVETVEAAFAELGPGELERFRETTAPAPAPITPATLVGDRIPAGNPRAW